MLKRQGIAKVVMLGEDDFEYNSAEQSDRAYKVGLSGAKPKTSLRWVTAKEDPADPPHPINGELFL
jgi:hypothetical protein